MSATTESPDVQAIRKLVEVAKSFSERGNHSAASKISYLAEAIVNEGQLDLDGFESLHADIEKEHARVSAEIADRGEGHEPG